MRIDFASLSCWNCKNAHIDRQLYEKYDVKRGLRDATGRGVLTSLTRISEVKGCTVDGQDTIPCPGVLYYRGYDVRDLEARALDAALILHADHGSNNSTFTNHVVTSSGTDTYSAIAASMASLKGPRHGGANSKVMAMMEGVVVKVGQDKTSGKYVTLRHGRYTVSYCHLSKILIVKGAIVHPRDVVGITGSTGRSTGEHLHITCKLNGRSISPSLIFDYIQSIRQECISALAGL